MNQTLYHLAKVTLETFSSTVFEGSSIRDVFVSPQLKTADGNFVALESLFERFARVMVVGSAGTGKTTLLTVFSIKEAQEYIEAPEENACPIFIEGRKFSGIETVARLLERVRDVVTDRAGMEISTAQLREYFLTGQVSLIVDGLDEIPDTLERSKVIHTLSDVSRYFPHALMLLSSRPSDLTISFTGFSSLYISSFGEHQVRQLISALSGDDREKTDQFLSALSANRSLSELASTPLLLNLLWNVFQVCGQLPETTAFLYSDFTDYLLSSWDIRRGERPKTLLTLDTKYRVLENIAVYLFEKGYASGVVEELSAIVTGTLRECHCEEDEKTSILEELLSRGVFIEVSKGRIGFVHLSFLEYYVARALVRTPERLINLVSRPNAHHVLIFACGLTADVAPIIEAAIEAGQALLAAKCISHGRTDNQELAEYVVQEIVKEVGDPFADLIVKVLGKRQREPKKEDPYSILFQKWDDFSKEGLPSHVKGRRFEEFVIEFFGQLFAVVSHDLDTDTGELDVIIEIIKQDSFWIEFGGDAFVECKNWASHIPLKDVGAFIAKVNQGRIKLAFFVSVSGFTADAKQRLRVQASNISAPLIVPIDGEDMKEALLKREYLEEFFKRKIREIKYLRKY